MKKRVYKDGYGEKSFILQPDSIKIEDATRMVSGYFAAFNNIDADRDKILPGSFKRSIEEHGPGAARNRKIAHLAYHDVTRPVGTIKELQEDDNGLFFRSEMGSHTDGEDAFKMYREGIITEHSVGFNYVPDKIKLVEDQNNPEKSYFEISEVKLWEGSFVVFGSNSETPNTTGLKSQADVDSALDLLNERMDTFIRALTDRQFSEKFNRMAQVELMQLKRRYNEIATYEAPVSKAEIAKSNSNAFNFEQLVNKLNF